MITSWIWLSIHDYKIFNAETKDLNITQVAKISVDAPWYENEKEGITLASNTLAEHWWFIT